MLNKSNHIIPILALAVLIAGYPRPAQAFGAGLLDNIGRWIVQLFKKGDEADGVVRQSIRNNPEQVESTVLHGQTGDLSPDQLYAQYASLKSSKPDEAYTWLFWAARVGSKPALREIQKLCLEPQDSEMRNRCEERNRAQGHIKPIDNSR